MPYQIIFLTVDSHLVGWNLSAAFILDEGLELLDSIILKLHALLSVSVYPIVCLQFFLKLNDCFVSFVQPRSQSDHDITLLEQELFVSVYLLLVFFDLNTFLFYLLHLLVVFFADHPLSFLQCISELRCVFYFLATNEQLAVHGGDLLLQKFFLFLLLHKFPRPHLKSCDGGVLVFLGSSLFFF